MASDPYSSPLAFFAEKLKRLRESAGMTQAEVAEHTNYALSTVSAYEKSRRIPPLDFAVAVDELFGTGEELAELQKLVESVSLVPWFRDRVEVERKAREIQEYESYQVPGLLQTEDYAKAIMSVTRPKISADELYRALVLRMTRQDILGVDHELPVDQVQTPRYWAVIDESALLRTVGNPEIMQAQRDHLVEMAQQPNVTIQIIPNQKGPTSAYGRAFTILVSHNNSSVVYLEDPNSAHYVRDKDDVNRYSLIFDHLRASALDDEQTLRMLRGEDI
ncbi:MAG: helix-turn-helix transcriptional regulator [Acidobacteriaceae bacterium]|nr:helix-turn-helix transcriptional regulator [Streptosporangiaceae bacterium]MBV9767270.1 helix-turn-helix transcriptional regulator [Acidobacteriaceae bacterium]